MKVKVSDLSGRALNYAVAVVEWGEPTEISRNGAFETTIFWWDHDGIQSHLIRTKDISFIGENFSPSSNWAHGGPLFEKSSPEIRAPSVACSEFSACVYSTKICAMAGPSILIAFCRAYVGSNFGDEVEIPDELIEVG
jgi:hypothetical protein